jgi:hypothetical protein
MANAPGSTPIELHPPLAKLDPFVVATGQPIPPIERVALFSADQWEEFINEWANSLLGYAKVEHASGSGDKGCDVIGIVEEGGAIWDNYQCKHYDKPLTPTDVWVELGKLSYYTMVGEYSLPRKYRFVAPRDVGTKLASLLRRPVILKQELLKAWATYCENFIKETPVPLSGALLSHIEGIDFSIFGYLPVLDVINQHLKTPHFIARFGLGLPPRPAAPPPPEKPTADETRYVEQLFEAYSDNRKELLTQTEQLPENLLRHYHRSRESFYSAEALRNFSRDKLPGREFEELQDQVYAGVIDTCESTHACGFTRLVATTDRSTELSITSSPLIGKTEVRDLHGICHQLANAERLIWVQEKGGDGGD